MADNKVRKFVVRNMRCAGCASKVEKAVASLHDAGVVQVNYAASSLTVSGKAELLSDEEIFAAVARAGFKAEVPPRDIAAENAREVAEEKRELVKLVTAAIFTCVIMAVSFFHLVEHFKLNGIIQLLALLPVLYGGKTFFLSGIPALLRGSPDMDSLISCGSGIGIVYSVYLLIFRENAHLFIDSAAMIITLVMLGKTLEARARRKASSAMRELLLLAPETALLIMPDGRKKSIPAAELSSGNTVLVRPGEKFPADGSVIEGSGDADESMLTGESSPVPKTPGANVSGGTLNIDGLFKVKVTSTGSESVLGRIIKLVSDAQNTKPEMAKIADKVAGVFTWIIFSCSLLTLVTWLLLDAGLSHAVNCAMSVMVAACPCALGLATPIALISGIGRAAMLGILIKNGNALENAAMTNTVVFDKTGTLTSGTPQVKMIFCAEGMDEKTLLLSAASAEKGSVHPLAKAICERAKEFGEVDISPENFTNIPGSGISCTIGKNQWLIGRAELLQQYGISCNVPENFAGLTIVCCARNNSLAGIIGIGDTLRSEAKEVIQALHKEHIKCLMFTGDNASSAGIAAEALELDRFYASLLPQDKLALIKELQRSKNIVAMTGDGINDSPALAQSDVGIAIGSGTAVAMESADMILLKINLHDIVTALCLSKACMRVIKQNLFWAFFYNFAAIPVAAGVFSAFGVVLNPALCAGTMAASSLTVVLNALRLLKFKRK